jgi:hypothetical protein
LRRGQPNVGGAFKTNLGTYVYVLRDKYPEASGGENESRLLLFDDRLVAANERFPVGTHVEAKYDYRRGVVVASDREKSLGGAFVGAGNDIYINIRWDHSGYVGNWLPGGLKVISPETLELQRLRDENEALKAKLEAARAALG